MKRMNLYEPYSILEKEGTLLHLKLSKKYKIVTVIASRILPFLVLLLVFLSSFLNEITISSWVIAGIIFLFVSLLIISNTTLGYEIYFKESSIELYTIKLFRRIGKTVQLSDMDHIDLEMFNDPRLSGAYYWLGAKNGKKIVLLKFSTDISKEKERFLEINKNLEQLTGLKIIGHTNVLY